MIIHNGGVMAPLSEAVLFPYDDRSIPFRYRLRIGLVEGMNPYKGHLVAMERGAADAPDGEHIKYYGSVCEVGGELRLWYLGVGTLEGPPSSSGGTSHLLLRPPRSRRSRIPSRRFKMVNETHPYYIMASFSPDGLRWTEGPNNPILRHNAVEPTGLIKHGGRYLLNGQGGNVGTKRALVTFVSYDFDHWSDAVVLGFRRDQAPHRQLAAWLPAGEQRRPAFLGADSRTSGSSPVTRSTAPTTSPFRAWSRGRGSPTSATSR